MRQVVLALAIGAPLVAAALALGTGPFAPSSFEFGTERDFAGRIEARPYPVLVAHGSEDGVPFVELTRIALVAPGKHGADPLVTAFDGRRVKLRGTRIHREGQTMVEVVPGSIVPDDPAGRNESLPPASRITDLGETTVSGEIVDSKCFLGVMNPGNLEVHRACAIRCISGGIPPMLYARDASGREAHLLLVSAEGKPVNREVLDLVARPVRITGRLERRDDLFYLYSDPGRYEPLR
jgi:hypothetical protein